MKKLTLPLDITTPYDRGVRGEELLKIYGEDLAPLMYEYCETSNPVVFDKNKDFIKELSRKHSKQKSKEKTHLDLFFYRLKKIIFLTDQFKRYAEWKNPIVIRDSIRIGTYAVSVGVDRWHVMRNFGVKEHEFLWLSNIEFSSDFKPKLKTLFTEDTEFEHYYVEESQRYKFEIKPNFQESIHFNLKQWLKSTYIEGQPSTMVAQPNRVTLRDAAMAKLRSK